MYAILNEWTITSYLYQQRNGDYAICEEKPFEHV